MTRKWLQLCAVAVIAVTISAGTAFAAGDDDPAPGPLKEAQTLIDAYKYKDALPILEKAVAAEPTNADAWNLLGYASRKIGRTKESFAHYAKALQIDPTHKGALAYLGELYAETGDLPKAKEMLARLDKACFFGCSEEKDLKAAIEKATATN